MYVLLIQDAGTTTQQTRNKSEMVWKKAIVVMLDALLHKTTLILIHIASTHAIIGKRTLLKVLGVTLTDAHAHARAHTHNICLNTNTYSNNLFCRFDQPWDTRVNCKCIINISICYRSMSIDCVFIGNINIWFLIHEH